MVGKTLGRYDILELLGKGGMGEVYLANDTRLRRRVALKLMTERLARDPDARDSLLREARSAAALNHPNVCTIHEVDEAEGLPYIAMEYVDGESLCSLVERDAVPIDEAVRIGVQIAAAVAHAHGRGVVHRDLKSGNVILSEGGDAKVVDFGLAVALQAEISAATEAATEVGESGVAGTLAYMAPEALRGGGSDPRSDLWSLGVILYQMVEGRLPFRGATTFELTSAILRDAPADPATSVPAPLRAIIRRCLEKEPSRRYQSAAELRAALEVMTSELGPADTGSGPTPSRRPARSVAVLPLENLSGDPQQEYFADGMTDALIADLSRIRALKVISRTSVMRYKRVHKPLREIADELGVDTVVEGTVLWAGDRVRITVQLIDAISDEHLWAESYQRDLRDILELQSQVARAVSETIEVVLTPEEEDRLHKVRQVDPASHDAYLKGLHHFHQWGDANFRKALRFFERAIEIDSANARAYAGIADCYILQGVFSARRPIDCFPPARTAASKALDLDDSLGEAHQSLASTRFLFDRDRDSAEAGYRRAFELNPGSVSVLEGYAFYQCVTGRSDEGIARARRAVELDPLTHTPMQHLAFLLFTVGRFDESLAAFERALELQSEFVYSLAGIAWNRSVRGEAELARAAAQRILALPTEAVDAYALGTTGWALAHCGEATQARVLLEAMETAASGRWVDPTWIGLLHEALGQRDQALDYLRQACDERSPGVTYFKVSPFFESLRADPRFRRLMVESGL